MKFYIDFDGVIVNTMEIIDKEVKEATKNDNYYSNINWVELLDKCNIIDDAFSKIKKLKTLFDTSILTHVYTIEEGIAKVNFIRKYDSDINIILVPKEITKSRIVNPKNSILIDDYSQNIKDWINNGGIGIKFNSKKFKIVDKLDDVLEYVKICE